MKTLTEVAEAMALSKIMREPERYLVRQIKSGKIRARKVGRTWMMTADDVDFALEQFANPAPRTQVQPTPPGMPSARSLSRRRAS